MTFPAHGHYMLVRPLAKALARRGHNVTMVLCSQSVKTYNDDGLQELGIGLMLAGPCPTFDGRAPLLSKLIEQPGMTSLFAMLDAMADVNKEMCDVVIPRYSDPAERPDVLVFDGDTFCVSVQYALQASQRRHCTDALFLLHTPYLRLWMCPLHSGCRALLA
jgi:hypothetical protein